MSLLLLGLILTAPYHLFKFFKNKTYKKKHAWVYPIAYLWGLSFATIYVSLMLDWLNGWQMLVLVVLTLLLSPAVVFLSELEKGKNISNDSNEEEDNVNK
ncbi:hypothetical protein CVD28_02075 [Bacillus sp. M6-12]|uniref:hypothetical protein n=1 Tax=Bacillus sp. M6-12 TaxID=2054166 RepID=UPI000C77626B|nr:hypothetical protein [Bacillus sp. M6-12]PLS19219.1 hypothetical protein CVD28_02075 [Bacillus sp. M6-12]